MKKSYIAYFLLLLCFSCSNKPTDITLLKGEITGLGNDTIFIYGFDELYNRIDTLLVTEDRFSYSLSPDTTSAVWLLFSNGTEYPLFFDKGEHIDIKGSVETTTPLQITGNPDNNALTAFYNELKKSPSPSDEALEEQVSNFIHTNPSSLASIYLLKKYMVEKNNPDITQIKSLIECMTGALKDRPYIENLLKQIQDEENATVGKLVTFFQLPDVDGKIINRSDFKDKYLLIQFWASWDTLSRTNNAMLNRIYKNEAKNKKFALLGISLDIDKDVWKETIREDTLEWDQVNDFSGWNMAIVKQLAIHTLPYNVLLAPTGRIEAKNLDEQAIEKRLESIKEQENQKEKIEREQSKKRLKK